MAKRKKITKLFRKTKVREPKMKSFRLSKRDLPFMTLSITKQTLYWSILMLVILVLELWILAVQINVIDITNSLAI